MKKNRFFGKYYKFISDGSSFSFAVIISTANEGDMLQVITPHKAFLINNTKSVSVKGSIITFDINQDDLSMKGELTLGELHPLKKKVMGPFTYLPMECRHEIYSMWHTLRGTLLINGKEVSATLTVTPATTTISATGIKLNSSAITIKVGSSYRLTATVSPSNVTDNTVTWSSSNTNIATVTGGTVTGKKIGKATITAKTHNGIAATATVTVKSTLAIDSAKPIITTVVASK